MSDSSRRPLRLAYFSPLAPQPTGIAAYSEDLLPFLAPWAEVHLFVDDYAPTSPSITGGPPVWNHRDFRWRRAFHGYDCAIYQVGNHASHQYLYHYLARYPGVAVLHDFVLHHLLAGMTEKPGLAGWYFRDMASSYGAEGLRHAWEVARGRREPAFFHYPLCQRVLDASLAVVVHSHYMQQQVQALRPHATVRRVAMGIPLPDNPGARATLRRRLGLPPDAFIFGSFGLATGHKRIPVALQALAQLQHEGQHALYVVAGAVAPELGLEALARELGVAHRVRVTGYLSEEDFQAYLHAVDVCVNLRYPTAGETSAAALRSMAAGTPAIVSDVGANRELPGTTCFKLPVGGDEAPLLAAVLRLLAREERFREELGRRARRYVETHHSLAQAARGYIEVVEELLERPAVTAQPPLPRRATQGDYLATLAQRLGELRLEGRDLALLPELGEAMAALGLATGAGPVEEEERS
ncbi:MAG: glycosyltransferase [Chloroflexi bacterium]|nr:glycosyltransferase [Chloroflexota bacterium]